jgi:hypothetical protein
MRSSARNEPERSSVAPATTAVLGEALAVLFGERRQQRHRQAGEGDVLRFTGSPGLDHLQLLELAQPLLDQPVREAAQAAADHVDMALELDHGEHAAVLERQYAGAPLRPEESFPAGVR